MEMSTENSNSSDQLGFRPMPETFPPGSQFWDLEGTPVVLIPGGGAWTGRDGKLVGPWSGEAREALPSRLCRTGWDITEAEFRCLSGASPDNSTRPESLSPTCFPVGTRFFSDDGEPVAVFPGPTGAVIVNFAGERPVEISSAEFMRSNPGRRISFDEFLAKAGVDCVRTWLAQNDDTAPKDRPGGTT